MTTETGQKVTNKDFGGKLLVLNFWATWCRRALKKCRLESVRQKSVVGVVVLGVMSISLKRLIRAALAAERLHRHNARSHENISDYRTFKWPETYVIDGRQGSYKSNRSARLDTIRQSEVRALLDACPCL